MEEKADEDNSAVIKLLVSNNQAGSIIGKKGSAINDIQTHTGCRIRLSKANDYFPGTTDRIVLMTGSTKFLLVALTMIITKIKENTKLTAESSESIMAMTDGEPTLTVKMVIPSTAAGLILGKSGSVIKSIIDQTAGRVQLSRKDDHISSFTRERVVTIVGNYDAVTHACTLITQKLAEDPSASFQQADMTTSYSSSYQSYYNMQQTGSAVPPYSAQRSSHMPANPAMMYQMPGILQTQPLMSLASPPGGATSLTIPVADRLVGTIVGKNGSTIQRLQQQSGASIKISQKDEYISGTTNRWITLTGTHMATNIAQMLINQRLQESVAHDQFQ